MFQAAALQVGLEFLMHMQGQAFALSIQLHNQGWVMLLYELIEERLLRSIAFVGDMTKGMPINRGRPSFAWRRHAASTPTFADLKSYKVERCALAGNI